MQITGHKNVQSLNAYPSLFVKQQAEMSHMISKYIAGSNKGTSNNNIHTIKKVHSRHLTEMLCLNYLAEKLHHFHLTMWNLYHPV